MYGKDGRKVRLPPMKVKILAALLHQGGQKLDHAGIWAAMHPELIDGTAPCSVGCIRVHITALRHAMAKCGLDRTQIARVKGGYKIEQMVAETSMQ